jgi:preprotein translocase subunit YajC
MRVTLVLSLGIAPALAQPQEQRREVPPGEMLAGKVNSVGKNSLTVAPLKGGDAVTIKVSDSTRVMKDRQPASLSDIKTGDTVFARGNLKGNIMEALIVGVIPPEMAERLQQGGGRGIFMAGPGQGGFSPEDMGKKFMAGEVKAINETRLTISRPDGQTQEIEVDENTSFKRGNESITLADIKVGDFVRGPGELKNNVFTPKELRVGRPRMQMEFRNPGNPSAPDAPADKKPAPPAPPN